MSFYNNKEILVIIVRGPKEVVIYEVGILHEGILLISKEYYKDYKITLDPSLRGGIFTALNTLASEIFSDKIESFNLQNYRAIILTRPHPESSKTELLFYCIGDKKINLNLAKETLTKISDSFFENYTYSEITSGNIDIYKQFEKEIGETLGDLVKSYSDRMKSIFG